MKFVNTKTCLNKRCHCGNKMRLTSGISLTMSCLDMNTPAANSCSMKMLEAENVQFLSLWNLCTEQQPKFQGSSLQNLLLQSEIDLALNQIKINNDQ